MENGKNTQERFGSLAETSKQMTDNQLDAFPQEFFLRYRWIQNQKREILAKIQQLKDETLSRNRAP